LAFSYNWLPDVAIADAAFRAEADTLAELFTAAALAVAEVMVNVRQIRACREHAFEIHADNVEDLLYRWLSELIYVIDVHHLIFVEHDISIDEKNGGLTLKCTARGEEIDPQRHQLGRDVKAVTYHLFEVKEVGGKYQATVVLDI
jgi:SHS2 domain-containing protein